MGLAETFLLLLSSGLAASGLFGYLIFGTLAYKHVEERGRDASLGGSSLSPAFFWWILSGRYRTRGDRGLDGLAVAAQWLGWTLVIGLAGSGLWLLLQAWRG
jgi:hypothetical protein